MATLLSEVIGIDRLRSLPIEWLYPSAVVDFTLLYAGAKPAARVELRESESSDALASWCRQSGLDYACDPQGFFLVSVRPGTASQIMQLDRSFDPHELELGLALGYPRCCCERVAQIGESQIDAYARLVAHWEFAGLYKRINPSGYVNGLALVSHLPCTADCDRSLAIAQQARQFVRANFDEPILRRLANSLLVLDEPLGSL